MGKDGVEMRISKGSWGKIENSGGTDGKWGKGWKTFGTGQLEQEHDPNIHNRTVYVRKENAKEFIDKITGGAVDPPKGAREDGKEKTKTKYEEWCEIAKVISKDENITKAHAIAKLVHATYYETQRNGKVVTVSTIERTLNRMKHLWINAN